MDAPVNTVTASLSLADDAVGLVDFDDGEELGSGHGAILALLAPEAGPNDP
jgi:hypothetical protein